MFEDRPVLRTNLSLVMAVAFHIAGIFLLSRPAAQGGSAADLQEVSFMDVTYRPEVAKILPKTAIPSGGGGSGPADFGSGAPGGAALRVSPLVRSNSTMRRPQSRAGLTGPKVPGSPCHFSPG